MTALEEFAARLHTVIGKPTDLRPFVCDGSPLECQAFLVGLNPATPLSADFWGFWQPGYGFNKLAWLDQYKRERGSRPLRPGSVRRLEVSPTRRVIEWVVEEAAPVKCLETNIYALATQQFSDLALSRRVTAPFEFLRSVIRPKLIVAHGKDAAILVGGQVGEARVVCVPHFSRGWSRIMARELGRQIRAYCETAT